MYKNKFCNREKRIFFIFVPFFAVLSSIYAKKACNLITFAESVYHQTAGKIHAKA